MTSIQEFLYICLYGVVFCVAIFVVILFLGITGTTEKNISLKITENASVDERMTIYDDTEQNYTTIAGTNIITDIITIIKPFNEVQIKNEIVKFKIENYEITKEDLIDVKNSKKEGITNIKSIISASAEYRRVNHYDEDYNVIGVDYVKE